MTLQKKERSVHATKEGKEEKEKEKKKEEGASFRPYYHSNGGKSNWIKIYVSERQ